MTVTDTAVPTTETVLPETVLHEPSFANAAAAIEAASELPTRTRSHWVCSLRQIARAMDRPMDIVPARWTAVRFPVGRLHHARVGANPKTLANHKSNVRAALLWFGRAKDVPSRGAPLTPEWRLLRDRLTEFRTRATLSSLMRYGSARGLVPEAVDEAAIDGYMRYRAETTNLASNDAARRTIARAWNRCADAIAGWPARRLAEPALKSRPGPSWGDFPEGLRSDIERYLAGLTRIRRNARGKRLRPCRPTTIRTRRAELIAAARMAVREGVEIERLTSLSALLDPDVVAKVIDAYWRADGEAPRVYTIDLGAKFLSIARGTGSLDPDALERLDDIRASLEDHRQFGLTEKNLAVIRQVLSGSVWDEVIKLPYRLMEQARSMREHAPVKAAVTAQLAVGIAILTVAPVRLGNLVRIRLDQNLTKPGGLNAPYWLVFPDYDVKNRVRLQFALDEPLTALIDEYIHHFRSRLLRGSNDLWLFPGEAGGGKDARTFSEQITKRVEAATGLRITVHQFRHAAAAVLLKLRPGEYELVRQLLGHHNLQTTIRFYCALETMQATAILGEVVRKKLKFEPEPV